MFGLSAVFVVTPRDDRRSLRHAVFPVNALVVIKGVKMFRQFSIAAANALGSSWMFIANVLLILLWLIAGPFFKYSDTWQLVVNTATTVITYLAVFLIQNTQNRDAKAIHLKLDELIKGVGGARTHLDQLIQFQMNCLGIAVLR